jgi:hypothetical protein
MSVRFGTCKNGPDLTGAITGHPRRSKVNELEPERLGSEDL